MTHDGIGLFAGNSVKQSLGINSFDIIGEDIIEKIHPEDQFLALKFLKKQDNNPRIIKGIELRLSCRKKTWCYYETMFCPILDTQNKTVICYVMHAIDITRRKKLEAALEKRERIYRSLLRTSPDAIVLFDSEGDVILANDKAAAIIGSVREELLGRSFLSFIIVEEHAAAKRLFKELIKTGHVNDWQFTCIRDDSLRVPIEVSFSAV